MKKLFFVCLLALGAAGFAQEAKKFNKAFYKEVTFETDDYKLYLVRCFTEKNILKMKLRIFNKTKDYIWIKPEEFVVNIGGESIKGDGKPIAVQPDGDEARMFDMKPKDLKDMRVDAFEVVLNGFYKVPVDGDVFTLANYPLPGKRGSEFTVGPFKCNLVDDEIKAKVAEANFHCTYTGDKIGLIDVSKAEGELANGSKVKNSVYAQGAFFNKAEGTIMEKGVERALKMDCKFNNTGKFDDGFSVKWNSTFSESKLVAYKVIKVPMQLDLEKSEK